LTNAAKLANFAELSEPYAPTVPADDLFNYLDCHL
jgi:hypothetical protein